MMKWIFSNMNTIVSTMKWIFSNMNAILSIHEMDLLNHECDPLQDHFPAAIAGS
jgi:hypothetical protein